MRPFAVYPDSFDGDTLGWWRFGERGGLLTDIVAGKVLTNFGAQPLDEGYRFVHTDPDRMDVAFAGEPERAALTLEMWVREWRVATGTWAIVATYGIVDYELHLLCQRQTAPTASRIAAYFRIGGADVGIATWSSTDIEPILAGPAPWHLAAVLNAPTNWTLFVNGIQRAQDTRGIVALPAGDQTLRLGAWIPLSNYSSCILDEVRLSKVARYAADFPITRFQGGRRLGLRGPEIMATAGGIP